MEQCQLGRLGRLQLGVELERRRWQMGKGVWCWTTWVWNSRWSRVDCSLWLLLSWWAVLAVAAMAALGGMDLERMGSPRDKREWWWSQHLGLALAAQQGWLGALA